MKKFLVVVDTQYDFVMPNGALYVQGAEEIILPGIDFLANLNPADYEGVLFTYDTHTPDIYNGSSESEMFPIHCVKGTPGWENVFNQQLLPDGFPIYTLEKGVFNMWEEEDLLVSTENHPIWNNFYRKALIKDLIAAGVETVEVFGVASDFCVKWAVDGFIQHSFKVNVIGELCRGIGAPASDVFDGPDYVDVKLV